MTALFSTLALVCVATQPEAVAHFCQFQNSLDKHTQIEIIALDQAASAAEQRKANFYDALDGKGLSRVSDAERLLALERTLEMVKLASHVIVDIGDPFTIKLFDQLQSKFPHIQRWVYYDKPESYVPGGYSKSANKLISLAHGILFANANLPNQTLWADPNSPIDTSHCEQAGIGYCPLDLAINLRSIKGPKARANLLSSLNLPEQHQKIMLYIGHSSDEYFQKAFPAFLNMLDELTMTQDISNWCIVLHQHPNAKEFQDELILLREWKKKSPWNRPQIYINPVSFTEALAGANLALYYQAASVNQLVMAGMPTLQVTHKTYPDLAIRSGLVPSVTRARTLYEQANTHLTTPPRYLPTDVYNKLGIREDWEDVLMHALNITPQVAYHLPTQRKGPLSTRGSFSVFLTSTNQIALLSR